MPPVPALIFDLDGTLADTAPDLLGATNAVLAARGRPLLDLNHLRHMVGFGARALQAGDEPKYLNSPDTPLFDKGRTLYNLDKASAAARKADRVFVVEGYMDVVALAQSGSGTTTPNSVNLKGSKNMQ